MNPAIAKLTPMLLESMADTLEGSGISVTGVTVSAMDSWVQFYKNIPMALIAFVLLEGGIFTKEYQSGTLILTLTKGLPRHQIVLSKSLMLVLLWSAGYWLCYGITWFYSDYYWDNSIAQNLGLAALSWWVFGVWILSLICLFSTVFFTNAGVLLGTGSMVLACYLLSIVPKISEHLPTALTSGNALIYGNGNTSHILVAMTVTALLSVISFTASIFIFNKKQM
jgi:ABC-2 type transport system permease protein